MHRAAHSAVLLFVLPVLLCAVAPAEAGGKMGRTEVLGARLKGQLHPRAKKRQSARRRYRGWKLQRDGARRERRVRLWLRLRHPFARQVTHPMLVNARGRPVKVKGTFYEPDLALIYGFGPFRWAELFEISTPGEKRHWDDPRRHPKTHKAQQRRTADASFRRRGRLYVLSGPARHRRTRPIRVFKRGPLKGRVKFIATK